MIEKKLGKIARAEYGFGGYQDAQFGLSVTLTSGSWGVGDFWGMWGMEPDSHNKWTKADQIKAHGEAADRICKLLKEANVQSVSDLKGIPVEVTFDDTILTGWRVLTEVITQ